MYLPFASFDDLCFTDGDIAFQGRAVSLGQLHLIALAAAEVSAAVGLAWSSFDGLYRSARAATALAAGIPVVAFDTILAVALFGVSKMVTELCPDFF